MSRGKWGRYISVNFDKDLQDLKDSYRKIFTVIADDIDSRLNNGETLEQVETFYRLECFDILKQISADREHSKCSGCGDCCRFAVSEFSPSELKQKAKSGDNYAAQFVETFVPYESLEDAKTVYPEYVEFLEQNSDEEFYIYHCPKVTEDNRCPDYENRPQICRDFPEMSNLFLPKTCAFHSWNLKSQPVWLKLNVMMEIMDFYKNVKKDL
ncbi:MAG: YkgJ family cysteine cluster protein [Muribaculaceae bacterium]|nr:YkgJ family cysteine cluster protein [Muribaculaceae bacterium]